MKKKYVNVLLCTISAVVLFGCGKNSIDNPVNSISNDLSTNTSDVSLSSNEITPIEIVINNDDRTNLYELENTVVFDGFVCSGSGNDQNGYEFTEEFLDALVPGSVIEIEYKSEDGRLWLVFPFSDNGWIRVGMDDTYTNESMTTAQIKYEQIAALLGDDKSKWGSILQCESETPWSVARIMVGTPVSEPSVVYRQREDFTDFVCTGEAEELNGFPFSQEILDSLIPGTVLRIDYTSDDNSLWIANTFNPIESDDPEVEPVIPDPVLINGEEDIVYEEGCCYISYETLLSKFGKDKTKWGENLMCSSSSSWSVSNVSVGFIGYNAPHVRGLYEFENFVAEGVDDRSSGFEMTDEFRARIVPGCVIVIKYESEDDSMWIDFPWADDGFMRCGVDDSIRDYGTCYVTYDMLVNGYNEDVSTWGDYIACESHKDWSVTALYIGMTDEQYPPVEEDTTTDPYQ